MKQQSKDWKEKYFDTLKELDEREHNWRRIENLLRGGINRLAMLSQDGHKELDRNLHQIRTLSRGNNNIESLEKALASINKHGSGDMPVDNDREVSQAINIISSLLPLEKQHIADIDTHCQQNNDQAALKVLIKAISKLFRPEEPISSEQLATTLLSLLTQLDHSEIEKRTIDEVQAEITPKNSVRQWRTVIEKIIDHVSVELKTIHGKKTKLQIFIKQLTEQLSELEKHALSAMENTSKAKQRASNMNSNLSQELTSLSKDVVESDDLSNIKQQISHRLSSALENMQQYFAKENQHYGEAEAANQALASQLQSARREAGELRSELEQSRAAQRQDKLTGMANRHAYDERVVLEVDRHFRENQSLIYAIWDIDHFKAINDTHGHMAGDVVLKLVAQLLKKSIRQTDFVARIGGEEFVMLLPNTSEEEAKKLIEVIRQSIEKNSFNFKGQSITVTASCGYTRLKPVDNIDALYDRADKMLYRAKHEGRNRCLSDSAAA